MTDKPLTPAVGAAPQRAVPTDAGPNVNEAPAMAERPTIGVVLEEGTPGFGHVTLSGLRDAPAGETITIGRPDANNHSPSISGISIAWIESPAGDITGVGAVMLQRLGMGAVGKTIDLATLAVAANDNATWVTDLSGTGAIGCEPRVAELTSGDVLIAWIGADGHARGRLYPPTDAAGASEGRGHAALNAALDDLGPVDARPDGSSRLQVAELHSGAFAIEWTALALGEPVLRGSLFLSHADADPHDRRGGWTQHPIADVPLPRGPAGPISIALAGEEEDAGLAVMVSGAGGSITLKVLDCHAADIAGNGLAADSEVLAHVSADSGPGNCAGAPAEARGEAAIGLDVLPDARQPPALGNDNGTQPSALGDGIVAAYVDADDGVLVVKTYAGDGAQIGQAEVVDPGDDGAIGEFAVASSGGDEFAVIYVQLSGAAGACTADYGNILLQRYCVTTLGDAACLVELGRDGDRDGVDVAAQLTMEGGDPSASNLAVGRAPAAIGVGEGGLAIAWVEKDGARETVKGVMLDQHGAEVLFIDLSGLLGEARIAEGAKPVLLNAGGGSFLVSWLQPDANGGCTVMAAMFRETAPDLWIAPDRSTLTGASST